MRLLYLAAFATQTVVALVVGVVVRILTRLPPPATALLGWILVVLALLQVALGAGLGVMAGRYSSRSAALSGTITLGVVLATPAWYAALAFATAQGTLPALGLLTCLALAYAVGLLMVTRLAVAAAAAAPEPPRRAGGAAGTTGETVGERSAPRP